MPEQRLIDGRDMQPPEPMELTLMALESLPADGEIVLLLYCQPHPLYQILQRNGYTWTERRLDDGTNEVRIRKS